MVNRKKRAGGRSARQAERERPKTLSAPYIKRNIPIYNLLDEESLTLIENKADSILQEIGIEFRGDMEALAIAKDMKLAKLEKEHKGYLAYHRAEIFKKN